MQNAAVMSSIVALTAHRCRAHWGMASVTPTDWARRCHTSPQRRFHPSLSGRDWACLCSCHKPATSQTVTPARSTFERRYSDAPHADTDAQYVRLLHRRCQSPPGFDSYQRGSCRTPSGTSHAHIHVEQRRMTPDSALAVPATTTPPLLRALTSPSPSASELR